MKQVPIYSVPPFTTMNLQTAKMHSKLNTNLLWCLLLFIILLITVQTTVSTDDFDDQSSSKGRKLYFFLLLFEINILRNILGESIFFLEFFFSLFSVVNL